MTYRMLHFTGLDKAEADAICDRAGIKRREVKHATRGWSYTSLHCNGNRCGEITPRGAGQPLTLAIDLDQLSCSARTMVLAS